MIDTILIRNDIEKSKEFGKYFIYAVFAFWAGAEVLLNSKIEKILWWNAKDINNNISVAILILLVMQIVFFQQYTLRELIIIGFFSVPIILSTIYSGSNVMMSTWIFIIALKYIDFDRVVKITYYIEFVASIIVIYLYSVGVIGEVTRYRNSKVRHSLGFCHPNQLGIRIFLLVVCRCYVRRDKFNIFDWLLIISAAIFVNLVPNSKTSCYALILLAIIMALYEMVKIIGGDLDHFASIMIFIAIIVDVLSLILSFLPVKKYPVFSRFDRMMSLRFSECHKTFLYYGVRLFGQRIELLFSRPGIGRV